MGTASEDIHLPQDAYWLSREVLDSVRIKGERSRSYSVSSKPPKIAQHAMQGRGCCPLAYHNNPHVRIQGRWMLAPFPRRFPRFRTTGWAGTISFRQMGTIARHHRAKSALTLAECLTGSTIKKTVTRCLLALVCLPSHDWCLAVK